MTILKMRLIVLIERLKKVTLVAQELGMKQPTVSFHMKKLEEEWGMPLFEHKTGKVLLTEAGRMLHHYAVQIDRSYSEAEARIAALRTGGKQTLRIGCTPLAGALLLTSALFKKISEAGRLNCDLAEGTHDELTAGLAEGKLDLILTGTEPAESYVHKEKLLEAPLAAIVPESHKEDGIFGAERLRGLTYAGAMDVALESLKPYRDFLGYAGSETGMKLGRFAYIIEAVRAGGSFTILPHAEALAERFGKEGLAVLPLPGEPAFWQAYAAWPRHHWNPQLPLQLVQWMKQPAGNPAD